MKLVRFFLPGLVACFATFAPSVTPLRAISGTLTPTGSLTMLAPASYVPGVPVLVRIDINDTAGNLDRRAWNKTATLTASNGVTLNPSTVTISNGMGSALVTITGSANFTLTANVDGFRVAKALTSLTGTGTNVSGILAGNTTWSGIINVTGDVTVPAGATLTIQPGTHVLVAGTPFVFGGASVDSNGIDIIVNGNLQAIGTATNPISMTCSAAANRWGQIRFANGGQPSTLRYALLSRSGHSPSAGGHIPNSGGPMLLLATNTVTIDDCVLADAVGKTIANSGNPNLTIRRTHIARFTMGPELGGTTLLLEDSNITEMLAIHRERGGPDDEDCIYIHDSDGRPVNLRRTVLAQCDDDALDLLGGALTVDDCIIRNAFDKGVSLLDNDVLMRRCQIIDNDIGVSTKCNTGSESTAFLNTFENCTIVSENHPTNTSDGNFHSVGIHTRNKYGTATMNITVNAKNCILSAQEPVRNDYGVAGTPFPLMNFTYTDFHDLGGTLPNDPVPAGTGNINADPLYVSFAGDDYHLQSTSPARDTGDPASPLDPDGSRADMGALPFAVGGGGTPGTQTWTPAGSPYHITGNTEVPVGLTLIVQAGTTAQFDQNARLTVFGNIQVLGTAAAHVVFSHVPGAIASGDCDPIKNGVQTGPPKWGGIRVYDSLTTENMVRYADFINAQGTDPATSENFGSIGFIRSWGWVDHCTFAGTHLRMCYGRNPKLTVTHCNFPDMFLFDPVLNRVEVPADFLASADNRMEPLKVEYPVTDPEVAGNPAYPNGLPAGGHWRVYYNDFHGNRGHQDVFDADSGRWGQAGQFVLDCRFNTFHGFAGDEHIDLGGDAYVAQNRFYSASKDEWTIDTGYSNAISTGDKGTGTTIFIAGNIFYDLDHAINCKNTNATIFEHNTCVDFHQDWQYNHIVTQFVSCSAVNLFVPNDGNAAGDGGYLGYNIFYGNVPSPDDPTPDPPGGFPRLFSWADRDLTGSKTSRVQIDHNFIDPAILDTTIGANHGDPLGIFAPSVGTGNVQGNPMFVNKAAKDFSLAPGSPAKGTAPGGLDYGATTPEWVYIVGGPSAQTFASNASFTIGGPGVVAYKWRLDGGAWSARIQIGSGGIFSRTVPTVRRATLNLTNLALGAHTLDVLGQDMAGNWQDADPARTIEGLAQAPPTSRTWTVQNALADDDQDGLTALVEHALGLNAANPNGGNGRGGLPTASMNINGRLEMRLNIPQNASAAQEHGLADTIYNIQASPDLVSWTTIATKNFASAWSGTATVTISPPVGGFVPVTIEDVASGPQRFLRFQAVVAP